MPIKFIQQKKKQKYLILILVIVIIAIVMVWRFGFLEEEKPSFPSTLRPSSRMITINFELLENLELEEFQPFEEIPPFGTSGTAGMQPGRENPFLSY